MVRSRRRRPRRYRRRTRRIRRRRAYRRNLRRVPRMKRYLFKRCQVSTVNLVLPSNTYDFSSQGFELDNLPDYTEFTNLFDQYRINMIKYQWIPDRNVNTMGTSDISTPLITTVEQPIPLIYTFIDYDDITVPASIDEFTERQNMRTARFNKVHKRIWKPTVLVPTYRTGVTFGYSPKRKQWIDCANPDVPHYGLKWCFYNPANSDATHLRGIALSFRVMATYYLQFRNVR